MLNLIWKNGSARNSLIWQVNKMKLQSIKNKKSQALLTENVVFIVIAVAFMAMLFAFLYRVSSTEKIIEEGTAKKLVLMIDSAKPGTIIEMNINNLLAKKQDSIADIEMITISGNTLTVKLTEKSGYSYSFFNSVLVKTSIESPDAQNKLIKLALS